jgi:hypothetical protein
MMWAKKDLAGGALGSIQKWLARRCPASRCFPERTAQ